MSMMALSLLPSQAAESPPAKKTPPLPAKKERASPTHQDEFPPAKKTTSQPAKLATSPPAHQEGSPSAKKDRASPAQQDGFPSTKKERASPAQQEGSPSAKKARSSPAQQVKPLGSVNKDQQFLPFKEALLHARALKLKGVKDWQAWCKTDARPANMPSAPNKTYTHEGWLGYGHWLGTGETPGSHKPSASKSGPIDSSSESESGSESDEHDYLPYDEAHKIVLRMHFDSTSAWHKWCDNDQCPENIPTRPDEDYDEEGFESWGDWLGIHRGKQRKRYAPFDEAIGFAHILNFPNEAAWRAWIDGGEAPDDMPANPAEAYKHTGWQDWSHWLGQSTQPERTSSRREGRQRRPSAASVCHLPPAATMACPFFFDSLHCMWWFPF